MTTATKTVAKKATSIKLIENAADVRKQIVSIGNRAKKLDTDIHVVGVSCMAHADKHGDVTLMQELINAMGRSQRKNAMIAWACAFGKFAPDEKGKNVIFNKTMTTDIEGAIGSSPWDFKPEQPFEAWDMDKALAQFMATASKKAEDGRNKVDPAKLEQLAKLVGSK